MICCDALVIPAWLPCPVFWAGVWAHAEFRANRRAPNQPTVRIICLEVFDFISSLKSVFLFSPPACLWSDGSGRFPKEADHLRKHRHSTHLLSELQGFLRGG